MLKTNKTRKISFVSFVISLFIIFAFSFKNTINPTINIDLNKQYNEQLKDCLTALRSIKYSANKTENINAYLSARKAFKHVEPILSYVNTNVYETLNQANLVGVDELGSGKFKQENAFGFQVIEELIFAEEIDEKKLLFNLEKTTAELAFLIQQPKFILSKSEILDLIRNQIIRTATLGITGFDSPQKQSLKEALYSYQGISEILQACNSDFNNPQTFDKWKAELGAMKGLMLEDFETFDRYTFIQQHSHFQLELIQETAKEWQVLLPSNTAIDPTATTLFSTTSFQTNFFVQSDYEYTEARSELGAILFNDKTLSSNQEMSCATCHQKDKAFTDGLVHFEGQDRNSPTILYAGLQQEYFYDLRSSSLQEQITQVIENKNEFHSDLKTVAQKIINDTNYAKRFEIAYQKPSDENLVLDALCQYVKSLNPFNSKFDRNMNQKENTLTASEKNGFNLFMGKAECGTCHFAPVFNGTVPPYFTTTEMELLGVPKDSTNKEVDADFGRFQVNSTENRKHFFKTPTVRNISKTAPYMHNGAYNSLHEVIEFYDDGGGNGLGFDLDFQTLPSDSLHLSESEIADLIAFMNSLEDQNPL